MYFQLFPYAKRNNIGLITRVPLDEGGLTGRLSLDSTFEDDMRSVYFQKDRLIEVVERVERLGKLLDGEARTLPELALRFNLSFSEISTVIPGTRKVKYVDVNTSVSDGRRLTRNLINELKKYVWERNFYPDHDPSMKDSGYIEV